MVDDEAMFERLDHGDDRTLLLRGEIDAAVRDEFARQLGRLFGDAHASVYLDLSEVTFIDSSALGVLAAGRRHGNRLSVPLILVEPSPTARRVLEVSGLDKIFEISGTARPER